MDDQKPRRSDVLQNGVLEGCSCSVSADEIQSLIAPLPEDFFAGADEALEKLLSERATPAEMEAMHQPIPRELFTVNRHELQSLCATKADMDKVLKR